VTVTVTSVTQRGMSQSTTVQGSELTEGMAEEESTITVAPTTWGVFGGA
jgi:hypothetical protein